MTAAMDLARLVEPARVHGRVYCDPEIFALEEERIWSKTWVYLGHESEVPERGDYVRRELGQQPVILVRAGDGDVRVLYNRCRHRANLVCEAARGHAREFICPYHGWSYALDGGLIAPASGEAYDPPLGRESFGLVAAPRVALYRGLIFASAAAEGPSLDAHLGRARELIDFVLDRSPAGKVRLDAGAQAVRYRGNWKMLAENSVENYHGAFVHKLAFALSDRRAGRVRAPLGRRRPDQDDETLYLGNGHMAEFLPRQAPGAPATSPSPARQAYAQALTAARGAARARALLDEPPAFFFIFPNLFFIQTHFRRLVPVAANETVAYYQPALLEDVPDEINRDILRFHETSFGPAGFVTPDDVEIMERNQAALAARGDEWLYLGRGLGRERVLPDGAASGHFLDETQLRGFWRHYATLMSG